MTRACRSIVLLLFAVAARAQQPEPNEGIQLGNYNVQQSVEFGGRVASEAGNSAVYDTFVNLHSGPRLLDQSLDMRAREHGGFWFDELHLESFGYGGDPQNVTRLRISKTKWYDFRVNFRRDLSVWDYNLLANPLNPLSSRAALPILDSPHRFSTVRRTGDYQLILRPQAKVGVRLGYGHNVREGDSFSSINVGGFQGAPTLLANPSRDSRDSYRLGLDLRLLPRTIFSFDEVYAHEKSANFFLDQGFPFELPNGAPVDLGVVFNTPFLPCAGPLTNPATKPAAANPFCDGFLAYSRAAASRSSSLTEQLSFETAYFRRLEVSGLLSYSSAHTNAPGFGELFRGFILPLNLGGEDASGFARAHMINTTADLAATWALSSQMRISESFHWRSFRVPGQTSEMAAALFATSLLGPAQGFVSALCPFPFAAASCPQHSLGSPADVIATMANEFLGSDEKENLLRWEYDFGRHAGVTAGYRFSQQAISQDNLEQDLETFFPPLANRDLCANVPVTSSGVCNVTELFPLFAETDIHRHAAVFGSWLRLLPADRLRLNFDADIGTADHSFTRLDPRQFQRYKVRFRYQPRSWAALAASLNFREQRNSQSDVRGSGHDRSVALSGVFTRSPKFGLDLSYEYSNIFARNIICYVSSAVLNPAICDTDSGLFQATAFYDSTTQFGRAAVRWKPAARVTTDLGYTITNSDGDTLLLNPLAPFGSLRFKYHQPVAAVAIDLRKDLTWKASWGYDDYNEQSSAGPTLPRSFHANLGTVSLRYSF